MWLMTEIGFFSIVQKAEDKAAGLLTVRSRVRSDLEALGKTHLKFVGPIKENAGTDYPYRARARQADVAVAMAKFAADVDYSNFKDRVQKTHGSARAKAYHAVWDVLFNLEKAEAKAAKPAPKLAIVPPSVPKHFGKLSAGGVVIDDDGRVLLREPKNHFGNYVWTFAKGLVDESETVEVAALREVLEETGYKCKIVKPVPGEFIGTTGTTVFFLMEPIRVVGEPGPETSAIRWEHPQKARELIALTKTPTGKDRDLAVLAAALAVFNS